MKRTLLALALLAACASPRYTLSLEPTLGGVLPFSEPTREMVVAAAAQMWPSYRVTFHGIDYTVGVDDLHRIRYIETRDSRFVTREGLRVGATLAEVMAAGGSEPRHEAGWGRYSRLQSGWYAYFDQPEPQSGTPQVMSYFRRDGLEVDQRRAH